MVSPSIHVYFGLTWVDKVITQITHTEIGWTLTIRCEKNSRDTLTIFREQKLRESISNKIQLK